MQAAFEAFDKRIKAWQPYPGARQLCATCDEPTERCEEDGIYTEDGEGPLCVECWHKTPEWILENAEVRHGAKDAELD